MGVWKYRYRNPDSSAGGPKYADSPGADFHLYNPLRLGPGEEEVWFTEGEFDCLALIDQGLKAIGIHGASNVGAEEKDEDKPTGKFKTEWRLLFEDTLCIVMFDNDEAGLPAGRRLARGLDGVAFDDWDPRFSDVNEWHAADREGLAAALGGFRARIRRSRGLE
jgi:DNA primase